jgi:hypothetical protein
MKSKAENYLHHIRRRNNDGSYIRMHDRRQLPTRRGVWQALRTLLSAQDTYHYTNTVRDGPFMWRGGGSSASGSWVVEVSLFFLGVRFLDLVRTFVFLPIHYTSRTSSSSSSQPFVCSAGDGVYDIEACNFVEFKIMRASRPFSSSIAPFSRIG